MMTGRMKSLGVGTAMVALSIVTCGPAYGLTVGEKCERSRNVEVAKHHTCIQRLFGDLAKDPEALTNGADACQERFIGKWAKIDERGSGAGGCRTIPAGELSGPVFHLSLDVSLAVRGTGCFYELLACEDDRTVLVADLDEVETEIVVFEGVISEVSAQLCALGG